MYETPQEGPGSQYHRPGKQMAPLKEHDTPNSAFFNNEIIDFRLDHNEMVLLGYGRLHGRLVELSVSLSTRATDGGTLAAVQDPELYPRPVCDTAHQAVQSIHFPHQVALSKAPDRRIAAHFTNSIKPMGNQRSRNTHSRRSRCGLAACVPASDNNDTKIVHKDLFRFAGCLGRCFT